MQPSLYIMGNLKGHIHTTYFVCCSQAAKRWCHDGDSDGLRPSLLNSGSLGALQKQSQHPGEELVFSSLSTILNHCKSLLAVWHRLGVLISCSQVSTSNILSHLLSWNYTGFVIEKNNRKYLVVKLFSCFQR